MYRKSDEYVRRHSFNEMHGQRIVVCLPLACMFFIALRDKVIAFAVVRFPTQFFPKHGSIQYLWELGSETIANTRIG